MIASVRAVNFHDMARSQLRHARHCAYFIADVAPLDVAVFELLFDELEPVAVAQVHFSIGPSAQLWSSQVAISFVDIHDSYLKWQIFSFVRVLLTRFFLIFIFLPCNFSLFRTINNMRGIRRSLQFGHTLYAYVHVRVRVAVFCGWACLAPPPLYISMYVLGGTPGLCCDLRTM